MPNTKSNTNQHGNCELNSELKDEEIIKDLKTFIRLSEHITEPPYVQHIFLQQILDLINRQKAEIERKTMLIAKTVDEYAKFKELAKRRETARVRNIEQCADKEIKRLKAKIERSQARNDELNALNKSASQEAIKEFAERLKKKAALRSYGTIWESDIDNLVKEMTE